MTISLRGAAGGSYAGFEIYDPGTIWNRVGGCYAFIGRIGLLSDWQIYYIGQTECFADRMPPCHDRWDEAAKLGATRIAALVVPDPLIRDFQERDMLAFYNPPLNIRHVRPQLRGGLLSGRR